MPSWLEALGAFLAGAAAVVTSWRAVGRLRRLMDAECEKRLDALREGIRIGRHE